MTPRGAASGVRDLGLFVAGMITAMALLHFAWAQGVSSTPFATGIVVTTCGTVGPAQGTLYTYAAGTQAPLTLDTTGVLCNKI